MTGGLWAAAVIVVALAGGLLIYRIRKGAKAEVRADTAERGIEHAKQANEIRDDVARLSDDELYRELRGDK